MPFKTRQFYKIVGEDGMDLWKHTEDYVDAIGWHIYLTEPPKRVPIRICTDDVLHASLKLTDALRHIKPHGINKWGRFRVLVVEGTPVCKDHGGRKYGFRGFDVLHEITNPAELFTIIEDENKDYPIFRSGRFMGYGSMRPSEVANTVTKWFLCAEPWRESARKRLEEKRRAL